jgi:ribosomal protein L40E
MITEATIVSAHVQTCQDWGTPESRRKAEYAVTPRDLIIFGQSPARWVLRPGREPDEGVGRHELLRAALLAPQAGGAKYVQTPETYKTLRLVCPKCGSDNPAAMCRKCNTPRLNQAVERPWAANAEVCKRWTEEAIGKGLIPVPQRLAETNQKMCERIMADPHCVTLLEESQKLLEIVGTWQGQDPETTVPVRALVDIAPGGDHELTATLGTLAILPDISPVSWQAQAMRAGLHIQAALAAQLFQAATGEDVQCHLWLLVESREPHLVGRRRSTPELDTLAIQTCDRLLERMAFCRKWDLWPAFDPHCAGALPAWSETYLEDWMTQAGAGASGYWAVDGVDRARQANENLAQAA